MITDKKYSTLVKKKVKKVKQVKKVQRCHYKLQHHYITYLCYNPVKLRPLIYVQSKQVQLAATAIITDVTYHTLISHFNL